MRIKQFEELRSRIGAPDYEAYKQEILSGEGLVLALFLDEGRGNRVIDASGKGNHGTIYDARWVRQDGVWALQFDGVNDYVEMPDSPSISPTAAITIEAWIKTSVAHNSTGVVTKGPASGDYDYMLYFTGAGSTAAFFIRNSAGSVDSTGATFNTADGRWHHYVGKFDGDLLYVYIDGTLRASKDTALTDIRDSNYPLQIGRGWAYYFNGNISEVRIYNRALSADEVARHWQMGLPFHT